MPEILKVTDPNKIVTDTTLLSHLAEQGIDKDYVELFQDYAPSELGKEHSPYAKFYRDLNSNKRFMVVSNLPMVDADGVKIEAGWRVAGVNFFSEKNNLFRAKVQDTQVEVTIRNDQPDGRKQGDKLSYHAQLILGGKEKSPVSVNSTLLPTDPLNENYSENVLSWQYSICDRLLRIVEGRIQGYWKPTVRDSGREVHIIYNQTGDYHLKLSRYAVSADEEVISREEWARLFDKGKMIADTGTFYPDAHVETTTVDGYMTHYYANDSWADLRDGAGNGANDSSDLVSNVMILAGTSTNAWTRIDRTIFLFDTSSLPDGVTKTGATLTLYGSPETDSASPWADAAINIYSSNPASNTALAFADYSVLGTTPYCDSPIIVANWKTGTPGDPNNFVLNAAGLAVISLIGITKLGARESTYDVANSAPAWGSGRCKCFQSYQSDKGNGYKPKLVVTYTLAKSLAGSLTPTGALTRRLNLHISLSGAITPVGAITRVYRRFKSLSGAITPVGAITRRLNLHISLSGTLTPTGILTRKLIFHMSLSGVVTFTGVVTRLLKRFKTLKLIPASSLTLKLKNKSITLKLIPASSLTLGVIPASSLTLNVRNKNITLKVLPEKSATIKVLEI